MHQPWALSHTVLQQRQLPVRHEHLQRTASGGGRLPLLQRSTMNQEQPGAAALTRWLLANDMSAHALGLELGIDPQTIRDMASGKTMHVRVTIAAKIEDRTGIKMRAWVPMVSERKARE